MSAALARVETVDGWDLEVGSDGERRVLDVAIGARAGLARPRLVREVIRRNVAELEAHGDLCRRQRQNSESLENARGRPAMEYLLNEDQAVALVALLRTPKARELRIALVRVFGAVRRRALETGAASTLPLDVAHGARIGDVPNMRNEAAALCAMAARASGYGLRKVHGFVRRTYRVPGIYHVAVLAWPAVKATIEAVALGRLFIEGVRRLPPKKDPRQLPIRWN